MKTALEVLKEARALIADPTRWTRDVSARDSYSNEVCPWEENAVCFCADGALARAAGIKGWASEDDAYDLYEEAIGQLQSGLISVAPDEAEHHGGMFDIPFDIPNVNDGIVYIDGLSPHEAIIAAFDHAITCLETKP